MTIARSILTLVAATTLLLGMVVALVGYGLFQRETEKQVFAIAERQALEFTEVIAVVLQGALRNGQLEEAGGHVERLNLSPLVRSAYMIDDELKVMFSSQLNVRGSSVGQTAASRFADRLEVMQQEIAHFTQFDPETDAFWVGVPFRMPPEPGALISSGRGVVLVEYNLADWRTVSQNFTTRHLIAVVGLIAALCVGLLLVVWSIVTRRIKRMTTAAEQMAKGDLKARIDSRGLDEIAVLGRSLVTLTETLEEQRAKLAQQAELLGMAGEVARFGGWRYDKRADSFEWSDEVGPIFDVPPGDAPNAYSGVDYLDPEDRGRVETLLYCCLEYGEPYDVVTRIKTAKDRHIWARSIGHPFRDSSGQIIGVFGALQDISELQDSRAKEEQQRRIAAEAQKNESIGRLTGGVAHDFNNLLAVIMGNIELLIEELNLPPGDDRADMMRSALNAAQRGADLTRNMLAFARRAPLQPQPLNLNDLVKSTEQIAVRTLPATIRLECSLLANLWIVHADRASIESAILNLVMNAAQAMPDGGKITLETSNLRIDQEYLETREEEIAPGRYVMLAVSDTGTGIAPDILQKIFEPFFSTKGPDGGTGLGLSMVQGFVNQSRGTVRVYSEVGVGTTFKLFFPAVHQVDADDARGTTPAIEAPPGNHRLLVVDDQKDVLEALEKTLRRNGYDVATACSGDEALTVFEKDPDFDLVITDIVMPGALQGPNLVRELRARKPTLKAIFLSGYASEATVHGNGLLPSDIRLMKPLSRLDFLAAVARALRDKRPNET
ncbi:ATP-binding protein [Primorskyibacter sp. 2E233]|uniref:ATP-binding protein n=1 Tax=Primorskyibacter sp. 2E233 TaxID=3413431 RepID=UPI003BF03D74